MSYKAKLKNPMLASLTMSKAKLVLVHRTQTDQPSCGLRTLAKESRHQSLLDG